MIVRVTFAERVSIRTFRRGLQAGLKDRGLLVPMFAPAKVGFRPRGARDSSPEGEGGLSRWMIIENSRSAARAEAFQGLNRDIFYRGTLTCLALNFVSEVRLWCPTVSSRQPAMARTFFS